jgi:superfamily I DNA/RNA helicase
VILALALALSLTTNGACKNSLKLIIAPPAVRSFSERPSSFIYRCTSEWHGGGRRPVRQLTETERFDHVLVDEYQDTNRLQASVLLALKPTGKGLTVVGDDAQSIYSFRAATVRNILD